MAEIILHGGEYTGDWRCEDGADRQRANLGREPLTVRPVTTHGLKARPRPRTYLLVARGSPIFDAVAQMGFKPTASVY
jgi:hypothetical protein